MAGPRQLLLPFPEEPRYEADDFIPATSNAAALAWLERPAEWPERRLAIWGQEGCGKTHLMRIWAGRTGAAIYPGPGLRGLPGSLPAGGIGIDDADAVPDETTLFHWLNAARDALVPVLITTRVPPAHLPVRLPDLASRLRAFTAVGIDPPEDALLRALLAHLLSDRQWRLDAQFQDWLLPQLPRTPAALREVVAYLDRLLLASGARITHKLVAELLEALRTGKDPLAGSSDLSVGDVG
jgi:chromosomal replication initiation ATPase DnaA